MRRASKLQSKGKYEEALDKFLEGRGARSEVRPRLPESRRQPRGTSGGCRNAEKYVKEALRHLDGMTERERFRLAAYYYRITGDYEAVRQGIRRTDRALLGGYGRAQQPGVVPRTDARHSRGDGRDASGAADPAESHDVSARTSRCLPATRAISPPPSEEVRVDPAADRTDAPGAAAQSAGARTAQRGGRGVPKDRNDGRLRRILRGRRAWRSGLVRRPFR